MLDLTKLDFAKFAKDWEGATEVEPVAVKHGLTQAECSRVAAIMRKKGVELKKFRVAVQVDFDIEAINKMIAAGKEVDFSKNLPTKPKRKRAKK